MQDITDEFVKPVDVNQTSALQDSASHIAYTALDQGRKEIRLLTVLRGDFEDKIQVTLIPVSLHCCPDFTALSYCWGDQLESTEISINEDTAEVPRSVHTALKYIRKTDHDDVVWIDFLCINQRDLEEKASQVRMMGRIYSAGRPENPLSENKC